ncbi:Pumilio-like protein 18 [Raphanus sativus]|uniref:Pumilio homolog 18-like n=1 Tax=Raphanus sativus TaxID=3726 RepID=A0A6J0L7A3_RAPSA|nr:pumilio homolog 18-like [Raphanus sativus]KAJ4875094.1 Pumilio-like protein 18 [Raphanus sativus]
MAPMSHNNPFSMPTLFDALERIRLSEETSARLSKLYNLMTSEECVSQFREIISKEDDPEALPKLVSLLTSDSDYFMEVVRNKHGSKRVQMLLGISDDVDALFYESILRRFLDIMTDKYACHVAIRAMLVFDTMEKFMMYNHVLYYALRMACTQYGCIALNEVITDVGDPRYRKLLVDFVACNAVCLSNDPSGNFVVQHVLTLNDSRCTHNVAIGLFGHCVDLSFKKYGSYIVEKLLEAEESMDVVVVELLDCEGDRLARLARNEIGNFVVLKALRVTHAVDRSGLFGDLVRKLMPIRHLLVRSHGSNIAKFLESCSLTTRRSD